MLTLRSFGAWYIFRKDVLGPCPPNGFDHVKHLFNGMTKSFASNLRYWLHLRKPCLPIVLGKLPAFAKAQCKLKEQLRS